MSRFVSSHQNLKRHLVCNNMKQIKSNKSFWFLSLNNIFRFFFFIIAFFLIMIYYLHINQPLLPLAALFPREHDLRQCWCQQGDDIIRAHSGTPAEVQTLEELNCLNSPLYFHIIINVLQNKTCSHLTDWILPLRLEVCFIWVTSLKYTDLNCSSVGPRPHNVSFMWKTKEMKKKKRKV